MAELHDAIVEAVEQDAPVSLRGVFYRCVSLGAVDKDENSYKAVGRELVKLRRQGRVAYDDIADGTRWIMHPRRYDSVDDALAETAAFYRRTLWSTSRYSIQVFVEKDAISGVIFPVTKQWDVPLGILRGYCSETFAWNVAQSIDPDRHTIMVQLGDHDPSGVGAWDDFSKKVRGFADLGTDDLEFIRLAVTPDQIRSMDLPTRPTKKTDPRGKGWEGESVEVDAIPAPTLREMTENFIAYFVDRHSLAVTLAVEREERATLEQLRLRGVS